MQKNAMIIGDSYSTFKGYIPVGYAPYYSKEGFGEDCPVRKMEVEETWWHRLVCATGAELVLNDSWSGTTIGYTGYEGADTSKTSSFIYRYRKLKEEGFFDKNEIDTLFVFGGTNDSWSNAPLGVAKTEGFTEEDLYSVIPAIYYLMKTLKQDLPSVRIVFIANCDIKTEIISAMKDAAELFSAEVISLSGITKDAGHPTPVGMAEICQSVLAAL